MSSNVAALLVFVSFVVAVVVVNVATAVAIIVAAFAFPSYCSRRQSRTCNRREMV